MSTVPLDAVHRSLGATMVDFAGYEMPMRYGSAVDEHHATREAAGLFDLSHMGEIRVTGPDAAAALDRALISHIAPLADGQAKYTMMCAADGGIIDDLIVYRLESEDFLVVANASNRTTVAAELVERAAGFDVSILDRSNDVALLAVQGPNAAAIVTSVLGDDVDSLSYYRCCSVEHEGDELLVARTGYTGEDGFELYVDADRAVAWWEILSAAGSSAGLTPVGLAARDTLRLEAGMPLYGQELSRQTTPFDTRARRLVAFDKPDEFVGRTALEAAADTPSSTLVGLVVDGRRPAREGYAVLDATTGNRVGVLTSGTKSPTLDTLIAMALLDPGTDRERPLVVDVRGTSTPATVVPLPFYKRDK